MANPQNQAPRINTEAIAGMTRNMEAFFNAINAGLASLQRNVARFVELANPAQVMQFNLAVRDMQAVIGQSLTPILKNATNLVRAFADQIVNMSGPAKSGIAILAGLAVGFTVATTAAMALSTVINSAFGGLPLVIGGIIGLASAFGLFEGITKEVKTVMDSMGGVMELLFSAFNEVMQTLFSIVKNLMPIIVPLIEQIIILNMAALQPILLPLQNLALVLETLRPLIDQVSIAIQKFSKWLMNLLGIEQQKPKDKSSVGAAVRNVQIGSLDSFIGEQTRKTFQGAGDSPEKQIATGVVKLNETAQSILTGVTKIYDWVKDNLKALGDAYDVAKEKVQTAERRVGQAGEAGLAAVSPAAYLARQLWKNIR